MNKKELSAFLVKIPKAEIHLHIEAVITLKSVKKLYQQAFGKKMPAEEQKALFAYEDLNGFIASFIQIQNYFQSVDDFNLVFDDLAEYLCTNNIVYTEAFFAPSAFIKKGFDYGEMVTLFSKRIADIKQKHNITVKLIADVSRTFGCDNAMNNYLLFTAHPNKDVIGIGLGGAEQKGPAKEFGPVFDRAVQDGYHVVAHAGEDVGPESIWDAIKILHSERIGHGLTAEQDKELIAYLKKTQLPIEVCVTSNVFTKKYVQRTEDHPVRTMYDDGVFITINTDDPVFFKTTLLDEFWLLYKKLGFTLEEIKQLIKNGFTASFLSKKKKADYCAAVDAAWQEAERSA
ncbi:MAG: adenosine deaminase [Treponema sp.]|nr:adenosine deaminase [Treponema sp.]